MKQPIVATVTAPTGTPLLFTLFANAGKTRSNPQAKIALVLKYNPPKPTAQHEAAKLYATIMVNIGLLLAIAVM
jgi:hypothetical protein